MITIGQGIVIGEGIIMLPSPVPSIAFDPAAKGANLALANLNTTVFDTNIGVFTALTDYQLQPGDKIMVSFVLDYVVNDYNSVGIGATGIDLNNTLGADAFGIAVTSTGHYYNDGTDYGSGYPTFGTAGDVIDLAINVNSQYMWIRVNGGVWNVAGGDPATNTNPLAIGGLTSGYPAVSIGGFDGPSQFTIQTEAQYSVPAGYTFVAPNTGLVAEYDAINYVSGPTWIDSSGNGNDLTLVNDGDIVFDNGGGFVANAYFNTGATGYFSGAGSSSIPQGNQPYTMMTWVKFDTLPTADNGLISIGGYGVANQSNAFRTGGSGTLLLNYWWGNDLSVSDTQINDGFWFLATVTCDGTVRKIYHNGDLLGTDTQAEHNVQSTEIQVAKTYSTEYLQAKIAVARIYNRELTGQEVTSVYNELYYRYGT